ncbi:hypothetical protein WICMUC_005740 [Wickerhamomyces mucosus]|uniref:methionyl-tRNA formyltransferase n=1 Tax=Wickerhamomyces mucosus TaxID=1378264 RepID=A0A9P8T3U0_9ASCO|nr:hypothetical protein WICMUC_005740 [Wickerhamomyces mucosus]
MASELYPKNPKNRDVSVLNSKDPTAEYANAERPYVAMGNEVAIPLLFGKDIAQHLINDELINVEPAPTKKTKNADKLTLSPIQIQVYCDRQLMLSILRDFKRSFYSSYAFNRALKVAFFGSDEFSIQSLKQLVQLSETNPRIINKIDVIAKHPKKEGRGRKNEKDLPIVKFALDRNLEVIRAESNSEIISLLSNGYSLAIAVSYGKLIPKEFIESIPHSLNVHPSLLPRYSGASPLQFALLNHDKYTGVTVQTLHPTEFDKGSIIDQTPEIEIRQDETFISLRDRLGIEGANLLAKTIESGSFKTPNFISKYEFSYASKIPQSSAQINWKTTASEIERQFNTLGPLFTFKELKIKKRRKPPIHEWRRVILYDIKLSSKVLNGLRPGEFVFEDGKVYIQTEEGVISSDFLQLEFEPKEEPTKFSKALLKRTRETPNVFTDKFVEEGINNKIE